MPVKRVQTSRKPVGSGSAGRPSAEYSPPVGQLRSSPYINTASPSRSASSAWDVRKGPRPISKDSFASDEFFDTHPSDTKFGDALCPPPDNSKDAMKTTTVPSGTTSNASSSALRGSVLKPKDSLSTVPSLTTRLNGTVPPLVPVAVPATSASLPAVSAAPAVSAVPGIPGVPGISGASGVPAVLAAAAISTAPAAQIALTASTAPTGPTAPTAPTATRKQGPPPPPKRQLSSLQTSFSSAAYYPSPASTHSHNPFSPPHQASTVTLQGLARTSSQKSHQTTSAPSPMVPSLGRAPSFKSIDEHHSVLHEYVDLYANADQYISQCYNMQDSQSYSAQDSQDSQEYNPQMFHQPQFPAYNHSQGFQQYTPFAHHPSNYTEQYPQYTQYGNNYVPYGYSQESQVSQESQNSQEEYQNGYHVPDSQNGSFQNEYQNEYSEENEQHSQESLSRGVPESGSGVSPHTRSAQSLVSPAVAEAPLSLPPHASSKTITSAMPPASWKNANSVRNSSFTLRGESNSAASSRTDLHEEYSLRQRDSSSALQHSARGSSILHDREDMTPYASSVMETPPHGNHEPRHMASSTSLIAPSVAASVGSSITSSITPSGPLNSAPMLSTVSSTSTGNSGTPTLGTPLAPSIGCTDKHSDEHHCGSDSRSMAAQSIDARRTASRASSRSNAALHEHEDPKGTALGIGIGSAYVQRLRTNACETHICKVPANLPLGLRQTSKPAAVHVKPEFLKRAMDIRYKHLPQRMLETEIDDDDDDSGRDYHPNRSMKSSTSSLPPSLPTLSQSSLHQQQMYSLADPVIRRSTSPEESMIEQTGKIKLFVANPDSD